MKFLATEGVTCWAAVSAFQNGTIANGFIYFNGAAFGLSTALGVGNERKVRLTVRVYGSRAAGVRETETPP
jgi:hypothetical protein